MDTTTCLKSLLLAIQQYRDGRTAQNAAQLQKQVEVSASLLPRTDSDNDTCKYWKSRCHGAVLDIWFLLRVSCSRRFDKYLQFPPLFLGVVVLGLSFAIVTHFYILVFYYED